MERDAKLGYGFLLVGAGLPYLADKLFGPTVALISAAAVLLAGVILLIAAHHKPSPERNVAMAVWVFTLYGAGIGALGGGITGAISQMRKQAKPSTNSVVTPISRSDQPQPGLTSAPEGSHAASTPPLPHRPHATNAVPKLTDSVPPVLVDKAKTPVLEPSPSRPSFPSPQETAPLTTPSPSLPDTATAYAELKTVIQRLENLEGMWQSALNGTRAEITRMLGPWKMGLNRGLPMPTKWTPEMVQGLADADRRITFDYVRLEPQIRTARENAIARMKFTPNQAIEDTERYQRANRAAETPNPIATLEANTPSGMRFAEMSNYLQDLLRRLGDCP